MTLDPNLSADACNSPPSKSATYLEGNAGDKGVHPATAYYSPDIQLNSGPDAYFALPGVNNTVGVRPHHNPECKVTGTGSIKVELYVCNPFISTPAPASQYSRLIGTNVVPGSDVTTSGYTPGPGGFVDVGPWKPNAAATGDDPEAPGTHRCVIARCYPNGLTPDSTSFHFPDDPHTAQHNIDIRAVMKKLGQGGGLKPFGVSDATGLWELPVVVGNPLEKEDSAILKLAWDPRPDEKLLVEIREFAEYGGFEFRGVGSRPKGAALAQRDLPEGTELLPDRPSDGGYGYGSAPEETADLGPGFDVLFAAKAPFAPGDYAMVNAEIDVHNLEPGEVAVIHGTHEDRGGKVISGITWALLMT